MEHCAGRWMIDRTSDFRSASEILSVLTRSQGRLMAHSSHWTNLSFETILFTYPWLGLKVWSPSDGKDIALRTALVRADPSTLLVEDFSFTSEDFRP
jgi:hypothetical protein